MDVAMWIVRVTFLVILGLSIFVLRCDETGREMKDVFFRERLEKIDRLCSHEIRLTARILADSNLPEKEQQEYLKQLRYKQYYCKNFIGFVKFINTVENVNKIANTNTRRG